MDLPKRKATRLKGYDYSTPGMYFVTICTHNKQCILSDVGTGFPDCPKNVLSDYGQTAYKQIEIMSGLYDNITIDKYVIMPNHIHMIIQILELDKPYGPSRTAVPTNSLIAQFVSTFKRYCNRKCGRNIWQRSYHDHIIRGEEDYQKIWEYIDTNVLRWENDCFYTNERP